MGADVDMLLFGGDIMAATALPKLPFCTRRPYCVLLLGLGLSALEYCASRSGRVNRFVQPENWHA